LQWVGCTCCSSRAAGGPRAGLVGGSADRQKHPPYAPGSQGEPPRSANRVVHWTAELDAEQARLKGGQRATAAHSGTELNHSEAAATRWTWARAMAVESVEYTS
jgi:hypothetical protein